MKTLALFLLAAALCAQVQPAPGWCSMAHCNNQMNDLVPQPPVGLSGSVYVKAKDAGREGAYFGLGCVSNGQYAACTYNQAQDALVYYDGDGNVLWTSGSLLDNNARTSAPIMQADGSVVIGDDHNVYLFSHTGQIEWETPSPGGNPISMITTPNGAIVSATSASYTDSCTQAFCQLVFTISSGGGNYTKAQVTLSGGECPGAAATATISGGQIIGITTTMQGRPCLLAPDVTITGDGGGAEALAKLLSPAPIAVYNGTTGALVGSKYLFASGSTGPYYETINTPCGNGASYPNRVYVSTNLSNSASQGALLALDIDPTNLTSPVSEAWNVGFGGPSGASPLCIGDSIYFDGSDYLPGNNSGTTVFGVKDNGTTGTELFHISLGPDAYPINANFAQDPRAEGGFWHQIQYSPSIYHRSATDGHVIESINTDALLQTAGALTGSYWAAGVFTIYGTPSHPYMVLDQSDVHNAAGYMIMLDLTTDSLVWALPEYPGNSPFPYDTFPGLFAEVMDSSGQPNIVSSGRLTGAYFIAEAAGALAISESSLSFGQVNVGTASAAQTISLTNAGSAAVQIGSMAASGDYAQANTCTAALGPGTSCKVSVTFSPKAAGRRSGAITITDNAAGSPQIIALSGSGTTATGVIHVSHTALSFVAQTVGTTSPARAVTLSNVGKEPFTLAGISAAGSALERQACPPILAPGGNCTINAMFAPSATGAQSGTITITGSASNSPQTITLSGKGVAARARAIGLSSTSLAFAPQNLGQIGVAQTVKIVNVGTGAVRLSGIAATGDATESNTCQASIARAASCLITVMFAPSATGARSGTITVTDDAPDSPQTVAISGIGLANPVPLLAQAERANHTPGGAGFTLPLVGGGFLPGATVEWNGQTLATIFTDSTHVSATVPAGDIATAGTAYVQVANPGPGGGVSNPIGFGITTPVPDPTYGRSDIPAGSGPQALATADFNGDGILDLAVADATTGGVTILLGQPGGGFATAGNYPTGSNPIGIVTGDFNGDGHVDLAVANQASDTVAILLGKGDGTFAAKKAYAAGIDPVALVAADLNGDGSLDLAVANGSLNTVSVLLGNRDGTFAAAQAYPAGQSPSAVVAGDFNEDGRLDLAVANDFAPGGTVSILLGTGSGCFAPPVAYPTGDTVALATGDFNGDGKLDLAAVSQIGESISLMLGMGDGTFYPPYVSYLPGRATGIAVGNFTGNGQLSIATSIPSSNIVAVSLGNGDGTFRLADQYSTAAGPGALVAGDFNGDGSLDLAVAEAGANQISVLTAAPAAGLYPGSLNFGNVTVGSMASLNVTLGNSGDSPLQIGMIAASSGFSESSNCPATLPIGAVCTISVTFMPGIAGAQTGTLSVASNAAGSPQAVALAGTGVAASALH